MANKFETGINILKGVFSLVHFFEALFSDKPKTGAQKKQLVIESAKSLIDTAENLSTGGMHNTWEKIETVLPDVVDSAASILYPPNK